jgi:hypothetical protein
MLVPPSETFLTFDYLGACLLRSSEVGYLMFLTIDQVTVHNKMYRGCNMKSRNSFSFCIILI